MGELNIPTAISAQIKKNKASDNPRISIRFFRDLIFRKKNSIPIIKVNSMIPMIKKSNADHLISDVICMANRGMNSREVAPNKLNKNRLLVFEIIAFFIF